MVDYSRVKKEKEGILFRLAEIRNQLDQTEAIINDVIQTAYFKGYSDGRSENEDNKNGERNISYPSGI